MYNYFKIFIQVVQVREKGGKERKNKKEKEKDEVCMRERERERVVVMLSFIKWIPHFLKYL